MEILKATVAIISFVFALVIGMIALFLPPEGAIDESVLWFTAQLLVFTANIFGFNLDVFKSYKVNKSSE